MARVVAGLGVVILLLAVLGFVWTICLALVIEAHAPFPMNIILIAAPFGMSLFFLGMFLDER